MAKALTLEQSFTQIVTSPAAKAKLKFPDVWAKIQPFLLMLGVLIPKIDNAVNAFIAGVNAYLASKGITISPKIIALWAKIKPFVLLLSIFGKKVTAFRDALIAFMDTLIADQDEGDEE